ncbi:YciI family protein [Humibacillus xanthopallidus]|uniref:YCII-related domain-containing protein n=1 Tax=Humibacillus xanthopallidus TaxID=412689 RepID=A0A543HZH7_9MICO|nr:YciI family protein [Humibacillus xanthopallidus]TQM63754.1 hypothetical protein FBY41_0100 [Humibacillus xanthopallidus]
MPLFAVTYRYTGDTATRDALRAEHRHYLRELADEGSLLVSGPYADDEAAGALLLFRGEEKTHTEDLVARDPFTISGVISSVSIREWDPVIGPLLSTLSPD